LKAVRERAHDMGRYCLNIHATYACAHSGACCTSGWPIPVERPLQSAVARHLLPVAGQAFRTAAAPDGSQVSILATTESGDCVFFERERGRLCAVHRTMGAALLPAACRNFPRVALRDARGVFVTLSHYCPTAAQLLVPDRDIAIVQAPLTLTLDDQVEGLDATGVLPPLLRPGMLMTLDGYSAWEDAAVATLNDRALTARAAVRVIDAATAAATGWRPGGGSLCGWIEAAFVSAREAARTTTSDDRSFSTLEHAAKRFLAAHVFANWSAYQAGGIGAVVQWVESALETLEAQMAAARGAGGTEEEAFITAVRQTDFQLRHIRTDVSSGSLSPLRRD